MGVFYQEEPPPQNPSKKCKFFLVSTLKDAFSICRSCGGHISPLKQRQDEDYVPNTTIELEDNEQEVLSTSSNSATTFLYRHTKNNAHEFVYDNNYVVSFLQVVVSAIRSRAMEKSKQKVFVIIDSFFGELFFSAEKQEDGEVENEEDFYTVGSCLSRCSSSLSKGGEEFFSVKTNLSRCSSLSQVEFSSFHRRGSILQELCHCEGWPFGLCRKAVLLPPLPKSPSESWLWQKGGRSARRP
ncbi:unnamed protein product [Linum tenue]|uniref:Uncharacterized protein n=1 Tax=Linum tenue TaxID=586396 RepID=A0AAV0RKU7_9ROSI|nr:unnamed protein product [Linum tenue]